MSASNYEEDRFMYKGYECRVLFIPLGHRCGYVRVPKTHPLYGKAASYKYGMFAAFEEAIDCHGGITYVEEYLNGEPSKDSVWIGFDCAHLGDGVDIESKKKYFPNEKITVTPDHGEVRDLEFCRNECKKIVDQLIRKE